MSTVFGDANLPVLLDVVTLLQSLNADHSLLQNYQQNFPFNPNHVHDITACPAVKAQN
jgi:hypothetical protein